MPIDPDNDPNEAYEIKNVPPEMRGPPPDWWMVTCNGIPVRFYTPAKRHLAERYASDPIYRRSLVTKKAHHEYCRARVTEMRKQLLISPERHEVREAVSDPKDAVRANPVDGGETPTQHEIQLEKINAPFL